MADAWLTTLVFAHVLGAALWVGGQAVLGAATAALRRALPAETRSDALRAVARRAQPALWLGLALAAISGLLLMRERSMPFAWLLEGRLVAWKLALTVLAAAGAALHVVAARRRMHPGLVGGGAAVALAAGLGLLVVGAMLRWS